MFRLSVLAVLLILAIIEYKKPMKKFVFPAVFSALTLILALRCGQGTDYFSYCRIYLNPDSPEYDYESGFVLFSRIFQELNLPYTVFVFFFSVIIMVLLYLVITKGCTNKFMALFAVYTLYYMQFFENGVRQALAMMLVLAGFLLAARKERVWYILAGSVLGFTFHASAIVGLLLVIPYISVKWKKLDNFIRKRYILSSVTIAAVCVLLIAFSTWQGFWDSLVVLPESIYNRLSSYISAPSYSSMSLLSRLAFLAVVVVLYTGCREKLSNAERVLFRGYLLGFLIYCMLFRAELVASRINAYFKITEIILIPNLLGHFTLKNIKKPAFISRLATDKKWVDIGTRAAAVSVSLVLLCFMYLKTTKDVMGQSKYYNPGYIYPYYNVFNVKEMYTEREAPGYVHKEFYAFVERENPQLVGYGDEFSANYFPALSFPQTISTFRPVVGGKDYSFCPDPLSRTGSVISLLDLGSVNDIYTSGQYVEIQKTENYDEQYYRRIKDLLEDKK